MDNKTDFVKLLTNYEIITIRNSFWQEIVTLVKNNALFCY